MGMSVWKLLIVAAIILLLFGGRNKVSDIMGDIARGIKSFKKGIAEDEPEDPRSIDHVKHDPVPPSSVSSTSIDNRKVG